MAISFNEEQTYLTAPVSAEKNGIPGLVIRWGLAKDEKGASKILIAAVILLIVIAIALFAWGSPSTREVVPVDINKLNAK